MAGYYGYKMSKEVKKRYIERKKKLFQRAEEICQLYYKLSGEYPVVSINELHFVRDTVNISLTSVEKNITYTVSLDDFVSDDYVNILTAKYQEKKKQEQEKKREKEETTMKKELSYKKTRQIRVSADSYVSLICTTGFKYPREIIFWTDCTPWNGNSLLSCTTTEKEADTIMAKVEELPEKTRETVVETILNYVALRGGSIKRVDKGWKGISYVCSL